MQASSAHFSISARFYHLFAREEFVQYTLQLAERLLHHALTRDHHDVISLAQRWMQGSERCDESSLASIADHRDANTFTSHDAIAVMQKCVRAYADGHCRMSLHSATAPNSGEIGGTTQPKGGLHELASVPIHLLHMVRGYSQLMATPQAPRFYYVPAATCAHALAKAMHAFPPANLGLPGALGRHMLSLYLVAYRVTKGQYSRANCAGQPRLGFTKHRDAGNPETMSSQIFAQDLCQTPILLQIA